MSEIKLGAIYTADAAMQLAIRLAYLGANQVSPNPMVGCVVLDRSYKLIGYGYHEKAGSHHAEVNAFKDISKNEIEGCHVFVTLEPCAHQGKTPPCADFLASKPIESLTYGLVDPNPMVAGKGLEIIKRAGIKVIEYKGPKESLCDLLDAFSFHLKHKRPFYVLKVAASLDGMIRDGFGESKWITTEEAREHVHFLRSRFQAVMVGKNTVLRDDPLLNTRHVDFPEAKNKIIIINTSADIVNEIQKRKLYQLREPHDIYVVCDKKHIEAFSTQQIDGPLYLEEISGIHLLALDFSNDIPLIDLSNQLYAQGIYDILIEGGSKLHSYFLTNQCFDRIYYYQANKILGGQDALSWSANFKFSLNSPIDLELMSAKDFKDERLLVLKNKN